MRPGFVETKGDQAMNFFQKLKDGANKATDYAQQTMRATKINNQIADLKHEIEINNMKIGQAVYQAYKANDLTLAEENIRLYADDNLVLEKEINVLEHEIELIKNEKTCECGKTATADARFCSNCGKKFVYEPQVEIVPEEEEEFLQGYTECSNCGMELEPNARFCEKCGSVVNRSKMI
jgi:membrane protease subunit (stomatin/prohibitin family)